MVITRDALRQRLAVATKAPQACVRGDEGAVDPARARPHRRTPAAVLIGLVARAEGPAVLLTERTEHLRDHAHRQPCSPDAVTRAGSRYASDL